MTGAAADFDDFDRGRRGRSVLTRLNLTNFDRGPKKWPVLTYYHPMDTIAARGLRQRGGRSKLLFSCRRASQRLVRRRWQLLSSEQRPIRGVPATSFSASKVRSAADSPCSAGGMREASSSTRRHGWAGQSSPAVRGVLASATVDVGMVSSEASAAHQAPRPDLLYRSGGGAFKRL